MAFHSLEQQQFHGSEISRTIDEREMVGPKKQKLRSSRSRLVSQRRRDGLE
jgi:hypothetical protein